MFDYFYGRKTEQYSFIMLPRLLVKDPKFKSLKADAKLLYAVMLDRSSLSAQNGWVDDKNRVFIVYPIAEIMEDLNCAKAKAVSIVKSLAEFGLIEKERPGQGKANRIYVKDFTTGMEEEHPEKKEEPGTPDPFGRGKPIDFSQKFENQTSAGSEIKLQQVRKSNPNYTNNNQTEYSYTKDPSLPPVPFVTGPGDRGMEYRSACTEALKENMNYCSILEVRPEDRERLDELIMVMTDTLCSTRKTFRISGEEIPSDVVKSRLWKVGYFEAQYVLDTLGDPPSQIRNIRPYMLTTLYNAPATMNTQYAAAAGGA